MLLTHDVPLIFPIMISVVLSCPDSHCSLTFLFFPLISSGDDDDDNSSTNNKNTDKITVNLRRSCYIISHDVLFNLNIMPVDHHNILRQHSIHSCSIDFHLFVDNS